MMIKMTNIPHFKTNVDGSIDNLPQAPLSSFPNLNHVWGTSKQEQVEETPQKREGGIVVNNFFKDIKNVFNKNKIDSEFTIRKQRIQDGVPITIRMNGLIYLIMTSLPQTMTNGICSPEDFGTLIAVNVCTR